MTTVARTSPWRAAYLWLELIALWGFMPLIHAWGWLPINIILLLWAVTAVCLTLLLRDPTFERRSLWNASAVPKQLPWILLRFVVLGAGLVAAVWVFTPDKWFSFVRRAPGIWAIVMVLYPILSVYPQGIVYRSFIPHRYSAVLPDQACRVLAGGLAFGWMHVIFGNPIAMTLTLIGGTMFARTHERSRSLLASSIEHALYGCLIFTVGWGRFFLHGHVPANMGP